MPARTADRAAEVRERLRREALDIEIKQDRLFLEGGRGWLEQVKRALDSVEFLVLVMTPSAMVSGNVQRESEKGFFSLRRKNPEEQDSAERRKPMKPFGELNRRVRVVLQWVLFCAEGLRRGARGGLEEGFERTTRAGRQGCRWRET